MDIDPSDNLEEKPKRRGKPKASEIAAKSAKRHNSSGGRKKIGRPKGDAGIINEYKARMLLLLSPARSWTLFQCRYG